MGPSWCRNLLVSPFFSIFWCSLKQPRPGDIKCFDSLEDFQEFFNGTIQARGIEYLGNFTNQGDIDALFAQAESFQQKYEEAVQLCMERNGDTLKYLGTSATVRDMVAMTDALDGPDSPINFYGASYGTFLANVFMNSEYRILETLVSPD